MGQTMGSWEAIHIDWIKERTAGKADESGQLYNGKLISKYEMNIYDLYHTMKRQNL